MEAVNYLARFGRKAIENGWPIVFLRWKSKIPIFKKWEQGPAVTVERLEQFLKKHPEKHGFGIRCGAEDCIVALDDDHELGEVYTQDYRDALEDLKDHCFPDALKRRGRPQRVPTRVFRLDSALPRGFKIGKSMQILWTNQFVAYNVHPDTGKPFRWLEGRSPANTLLDAVPVFARKRFEEFVKGVELLQDAFGTNPETLGAALEAIKEGRKTGTELEADEDMIRRASQYIENPEEWGWEDWNRNIMMPLWSASKGAEWGLEVAHEISQKHPMYDSDYTDRKWKLLTKSPPSHIGAGTLLWLARQGGMPNIGPRIWDKFRAFDDRKDLLNVTTGSMMQRDNFNDHYVRYKEKGLTPVQTFLQARPMQCFGTMVWDPSQSYGAGKMGEQSAWNTCAMPATYGEEGDVGPWLDLMDNVYDEHAETIIKRMAYDVQYPEEKPMWHELIVGPQGIGKNLNKLPLRLWLGTMARTVNAGVFSSGFNSYLACIKHLEVEEVAAISNKIFNEQKGLLASNDPWIRINEKFMREYFARNVASIWMSTNEIDSISLSPTERRVYVVRKTGKALRGLVKLQGWLMQNWGRVIWHLRHEVEVSREFGKTLPMVTDAMNELVEMAGRSHDRLIGIVREALNGNEAFTLHDLHDHLLRCGVADKDGQMVSKQTLSKTLMALGAIRYERQIREDASRTSRQLRLWVTDKGLKHADLEAIRFIWQARLPLKDVDVD